MTTIETAIADELAIRNVVARLAHLADYGDLNEYLELFTEDAVWQQPSKEQFFKGLEDIRAIATSRRERLKIQGPNVDSCHCNTTLWVEILSDDRATANSYVIFLTSCRTAPVISRAARYEDHFVKSDGTWKLASRTVLDH